MQRQPIPSSKWTEEIWSCPWCHADTALGGEHFEVSRPPYVEIEHRWVRAYSYELFNNVGHAYAGQNQTLCGIKHSDISGTPWPWHHPRGNPCPDCFATAVVIDARWPTDKRGHSDRHSVRVERDPASLPHRVATDWCTAMDDQLGHPDLALEIDEHDPYVRLHATAGKRRRGLGRAATESRVLMSGQSTGDQQPLSPGSSTVAMQMT
jgi:hypothetical protein